MGFNVVTALKAQEIETALDLLDVVVDFRNAIVHGNETQIASVVASRQIKTTMRSYRDYRRRISKLSSTMDRVAAARLASLLHIRPPW